MAVVLEGIRARFPERKGGAGADRACLPDARRWRMTSRVNTGKRSQRGDRLLANPVPCPGLLGPGKNFLKRLGARYAEPLPRRVSGPAGAFMRPGAPLSPGLHSKTRD